MHDVVRTMTFQSETYDQVIADIKPLLHRHWKELAVYEDVPLDPDLNFYKIAEFNNSLAIYTARLNGELIGYTIYFLRNRHPHYNVGYAICDITLVLPEHRNAKVATGIFDIAEADLKARGVSIMQTGTKLDHPALAMFLESRGHAKIETVHSKRL